MENIKDDVICENFALQREDKKTIRGIVFRPKAASLSVSFATELLRPEWAEEMCLA